MRTVFAALMLAGGFTAECQEFVRIPEGSFGNTGFDRPFWMGKTEVSLREFAAFVKATHYRTTAEAAGAPLTWKAPGYAIAAKQPVVCVTPRDAEAYCAWAGGRLPRDVEWEYAARAGAATRHYWGETIDGRYLWYRANSDGRPRSVGTRLPNRWGLYDVEGNVWEWTISEPIKGEPWANRRGGSWIDCDEIESEPGRKNSPLIGLAIFFKIAVGSGHRSDDIGFRCLRQAP